jgi:protein-S-isoprenylcysteine O-methyltransferase Ste14
LNERKFNINDEPFIKHKEVKMNRYPLLMMLVMLGLCMGMNWIYPVNYGFGTAGKTMGWVAILCGMALLAAAIGFFRMKETTVNPTKKPDKLVTEGIYRISRNPMYLGMVLILAGFPLVTESVIGLIFPFIFFLIMNQSVIPREERTVEGVFGDDYLRYRTRTSRWI